MMQRRELLIGGGTAITVAAVIAAGAAQATQAARPASGPRLARSVTHGFHATMTARPGMGDAVVALLMRAPSFDNPDCPVFLVGRSASDPDKIFVTEGWTSQEAHGRFFASDLAKSYVEELVPMIAGESVYLDEVIVGGKADLI